MRSLKDEERIDDLAFQFRKLLEGCPQHAAPRVEEALLKKFREHRKRARWERICLAAAAAIVALVAGYFTVNHAHKPPSPGPDPAQILAGFTPLPYAATGAPLGETLILRVQLPVESVEINRAGSASERTRLIPADLLIGADGIPRAVRLAQ